MNNHSTLGHTNNEPPATIQNSDPPCGVVAHPDDCLCDVKVVSPVEIENNIDPDKFWGMRIALDGGHSYDTDEDILSLLEALALAKDAVANMASFDRYDERGKLRASKELKVKLKQFLRDGNSIIDAPRTFGASWGLCLASLTQGTPSALWAWDEQFWAQIEDYIISHDTWCGYRALMQEFNIDRGPAQQLERLYRDVNYAEHAHALGYARQMYISSPRAHKTWIHKKLAERGYSLTDDQLRQVRTRLREAGLVPDRNMTMGEWREQQR